MGFVLTDFRIFRPPYELPQDQILGWFAEAHFKAEQLSEKQGPSSSSERESLAAAMKAKVFHYGCGKDKISNRGSVLRDFTHSRWDEMEIYDFHAGAHGKGMTERDRFFSKAVRPFFEKFYADTMAPPDDLIHVSCTGYVSPSEAQRLVDAKGWNGQTIVTHAYHMGCYAAFPAIRMATGLLSHPPEFSLGQGKKKKTDVVHTELCSLHLNLSDHSPEQLVVQSLFADGFAKYSVRPEEGLTKGLKILSLREETISQTSSDMTWVLSDWGMEMGLSREVPIYLAQNVEGFVIKLFNRAGKDFEREKDKTHFAIHPGGPLIIDLIQDVLKLQAPQVAFSREILYRYGNMSSATLPHVWQVLVENPEIARGSLIASLAFGPGLTLCGGLFEKL